MRMKPVYCVSGELDGQHKFGQNDASFFSLEDSLKMNAKWLQRQADC